MPLSFAALWERWDKDGESLESFTIVTTAAAPQLADIHDRQSSILAGLTTGSIQRRRYRGFLSWCASPTPAPM